MMLICSKCSKEYIDDGKRSSMCSDCRSAMGRRSKRKGANNERRFSVYLNEQFKKHGLPYTAKRTPRSGAFHSLTPSDIMFFKLPNDSIFNNFHWENKNVNQWDVYGWYEEATRKEKDIGTNKTPLIIARRPNQDVEFAIINIKDLIKILIENDILRQEK